MVGTECVLLLFFALTCSNNTFTNAAIQLHNNDENTTSIVVEDIIPIFEYIKTLHTTATLDPLSNFFDKSAQFLPEKFITEASAFVFPAEVAKDSRPSLRNMFRWIQDRCFDISDGPAKKVGGAITCSSIIPLIQTPNLKMGGLDKAMGLEPAERFKRCFWTTGGATVSGAKQEPVQYFAFYVDQEVDVPPSSTCLVLDTRHTFFCRNLTFPSSSLDHTAICELRTEST